MKYNNMLTAIAVCLLMMAAIAVDAGVTSKEAEKLKTVLTPVGAERSGNQEGTIPEWKGGYTKVPDGYVSGMPRVDPFKDEKPLFSINGQNVDQYSDKLTESDVYRLKKYSSYRIDVYPTHRTAAAPQFVYDNIYTNATSAKTKDNGLSIEGAYGGIPFPIPKDGFEVMWNHLLYWRGEEYDMDFESWVVTSSGKPVLAVEAGVHVMMPYYFEDQPREAFLKDPLQEYFMLRQWQVSPPFKSGETFTVRDPLNMYNNGRKAWQYLVGQRRVRRAPAIAYDTPDFTNSGQNFFDEVFVFNGSMDRYDMKLIGKKEMYVPYNCNSFYLNKVMDVVGAGLNHLNPDHMRWELHRVWIVEATLAKGKRHVCAKRRFYIDEDTWLALLSDSWDAKGQLWRQNINITFIMFDLPGVVRGAQECVDLQTGSRIAFDFFNEKPQHLRVHHPRRPDYAYTPEALAGEGLR